MPRRNLAKPFSIVGLALGEIYMLFIVFAPSRSGEAVPLAHQIWRVVSLAGFCGLSGALIGLGIGLLVTGLLPRK